MLTYGTLVLATGARARRLPEGMLPGILNVTLRTIDDAKAIRQRLQQCSRVLVAGAGVIGLEVAASLRLLGLEPPRYRTPSSVDGRMLVDPATDLRLVAKRPRSSQRTGLMVRVQPILE
jgi:3-phenylpropionate/trans-cinnamate dioxygenase ferredoxin reductase subunit